ncbi:MAG: zinc ribbon domain-containing protein [Patescibacteria group bacterium]|nr:zinc ribbon domain-containing protein [Patescibacteria group bacterium]
MDSIPLACPQCHQPIRPEWYFCANCGKDLKAKPRPVGVWMQIGIYALSIFLPPLGYWPGIRYFREDNPKAQQIGMIAILLTTISMVATVWIGYVWLQGYINAMNQSLNGLGF